MLDFGGGGTTPDFWGTCFCFKNWLVRTTPTVLLMNARHLGSGKWSSWLLMKAHHDEHNPENHFCIPLPITLVELCMPFCSYISTKFHSSQLCFFRIHIFTNPFSLGGRGTQWYNHSSRWFAIQIPWRTLLFSRRWGHCGDVLFLVSGWVSHLKWWRTWRIIPGLVSG